MTPSLTSVVTKEGITLQSESAGGVFPETSVSCFQCTYEHMSNPLKDKFQDIYIFLKVNKSHENTQNKNESIPQLIFNIEYMGNAVYFEFIIHTMCPSVGNTQLKCKYSGFRKSLI